MSFLWITLRMIVSVDIGIRNTGRWTRVVRRGVPRTFQNSYRTESLQRNTSPVRRRTGWLKAALAFPAVLITQHPMLPLLVPAQSMWA
jgi:hypothetical protein